MVSGLVVGQSYYFNVLVRDPTGAYATYLHTSAYAIPNNSMCSRPWCRVFMIARVVILVHVVMTLYVVMIAHVFITVSTYFLFVQNLMSPAMRCI